MNNSNILNSLYSKLRTIAKTRPLFLLLLPVFFVLHSFISNYPVVNGIEALTLAAWYIAVIFSITGVGWVIYRNLIKAALFAFFLMAFQFFFGFLQDTLKDMAPHFFISRYRFLLPAALLFFILFFIWLKKRKKALTAFIQYLNVLFILLILVDTGRLVVRLLPKNENSLLRYREESFTICDTCSKPDVYLIVLDEYAGGEGLKNIFNFKNSAFENELERRGFYVVKKSNSNYNSTPYSIASILNMEYIGLNKVGVNDLDLRYSYWKILNSRVINFFTAYGYDFYNLSAFDFPGQPPHNNKSFLPYRTELITSQTFTGRLRKDIRSDVLSGKIRWKPLQKKIIYETLHFNENNFKLVRDVAAQTSATPKFIYAHFMMPHAPYYWDSKGQPVPFEQLFVSKAANKAGYIEYLQYCNNKILQLTDELFGASSAEPIIILLGDHGYREPGKNADIRYDFSNLNAIYLPNKDYTRFSDSMTNVNVFRTLFNSGFHQQFQLLKDTMINLRKEYIYSR